jgi:short-subunit dehydrogenase
MMTRRLRFEIASLFGAALLLSRLTTRRSRDKSTSRLFPLLGGLTLAFALFPSKRANFKGKTVIITGGSRGLGLAFARKLLRQGANVTLLARDCDELDRAKEMLETTVYRSSGRIFCVGCDVTRHEQFENALAETRAKFGRIDALINNAGTITVGPLHTLDPSDFDAQLNVHLRAVIDSVNLVRPYLRQVGGGHIINISSIGGTIPVPHMSAYTASKFALAGFSEAAATELKAEGIHVTTVYPGLMRTGSPIQAVFKGDPAGEYAWFSVSDNTPGFSMSADRAAGRILRAAADKQFSLVVSLPAKLGAIAHALFPETFLTATSWVASILPQGHSRERVTGAQSRDQLERQGIVLPTEALSEMAEEENNQTEKFDADFNLGVRGPGPVPSPS